MKADQRRHIQQSSSWTDARVASGNVRAVRTLSITQSRHARTPRTIATQCRNSCPPPILRAGTRRVSIFCATTCKQLTRAGALNEPHHATTRNDHRARVRRLRNVCINAAIKGSTHRHSTLISLTQRCARALCNAKARARARVRTHKYCKHACHMLYIQSYILCISCLCTRTHTLVIVWVTTAATPANVSLTLLATHTHTYLKYGETHLCGPPLAASKRSRIVCRSRYMLGEPINHTHTLTHLVHTCTR